ncbi:30S ribosomal protein S6 [Flammeovirgaceae bacterium SG7u.111]|nr:30S ribosomal protein S6 [Flammeovirgaceae bacterium SG7u.132]WPO34397.1 30S ribosomal protein S6 [Flammeovirgaceae bacterium SG7u.111]
MSLKHYETVFIITPVLSEQQIKETVQKFQETLKELGADIYNEESWGIKKLAYPIDKKTTGYYQLFEFKADPSVIKQYEIELKRDEKVMRFITVSLDKYGVDFNEKRRQGKFNKKKKETESDKKEEVKS